MLLFSVRIKHSSATCHIIYERTRETEPGDVKKYQIQKEIGDKMLSVADNMQERPSTVESHKRFSIFYQIESGRRESSERVESELELKVSQSWIIQRKAVRPVCRWSRKAEGKSKGNRFS